MDLIVVDVETSDFDPAHGADIIELAWSKLSLIDGKWTKIAYYESYIQFAGLITPGAQAVHHITKDQLTAEQGAVSKSQAMEHLRQYATDSILVAHNVEFDSKFFPQIGRPWICTLRSAKHIWPHAPGYGNQHLRYWLNLKPDVGDRYPHQAYYDVATTTEILLKMLESYTPDQLVHLTRSNVKLQKITFGKHKGTLYDQLPRDYLQWLVKQTFLDADQRHTVESLLRR